MLVDLQLTIKRPWKTNLDWYVNSPTHTGNVLSMKATEDKRIVDNVQDLVKQYGEIVHLYFGGGIDVIIISGTDVSY